MLVVDWKLHDSGDIWRESGRGGSKSYLSDIDEPAHEILVAEGGYSLLSLLSGCIFHNSVAKDKGS